jgi:hypothetical protein
MVHAGRHAHGPCPGDAALSGSTPVPNEALPNTDARIRQILGSVNGAPVWGGGTRHDRVALPRRDYFFSVLAATGTMI